MSRYPLERRLMFVTDPEMTKARGVPAVVLAAVAGGVGIVQLRDKNANDDTLAEIGAALVGLLAPFNVPLIVNDRPAVAARIRAAGVHIGQDDGEVAAARAQVGKDAIIGWSVTDLSQLRNVPPEVDYIGLGPVFATCTKPDAAPPLGLDGLRAARSTTAIPIVAIGGIDARNVASVMAAGADGVAVVSAICAAPEPEAAARELVQAMRESSR